MCISKFKSSHRIHSCFFINLVGISWTIIKQVLVILLSFSSSLATKCLSLNDEACMAKPTVIDLNPIELNVIHS